MRGSPENSEGPYSGFYRNYCEKLPCVLLLVFGVLYEEYDIVCLVQLPKKTLNPKQFQYSVARTLPS